MKQASIIITVDTEYPLLNNFFQLLFQTHDMSKYELIVVDDHCSHHETLEYLHHLSSENRIDQLITLKDKTGFGRANNAGSCTAPRNIWYCSTRTLSCRDTRLIACWSE